MFVVHDIEPRCEARYSKCVAVFNAPMDVHKTGTVFTNCAVSLSIGWKIHHVTSRYLIYYTKNLGENLNFFFKEYYPPNRLNTTPRVIH